MKKGKQAHRIEINDLPDEVLVEILSRLSRMNRRDAVRTSILSRKWRYLPSLCSSSVPVTLVLDHRDLSTRSERGPFVEWVDRVLKLHHDVSLDGLIIRAPYLYSRLVLDSYPRSGDIRHGDAESWVYLAMLKRVKVFQLECDAEFPDADMKLPNLDDDDDDDGVMSEFAFVSLSFAFVSLSFVGVNIGDEVILDFLKRSPHLERLCIRRSSRVKDLKVVVDHPSSLKFLEISDCDKTQSLEISVPSLVSCTYGGDKVIIPYMDSPNLRELTLGGRIARSLVNQPMEHASYSDRLVKLELNFPKMFSSAFVRSRPHDLPRLHSLQHLDLDLVLPVGKSIHFFINFIIGSPLLKQLRIKISYMVTNPRSLETLGFPEESPSTKKDRVCHKNLKVVKMSGYVGCAIDDKFILRILNIAHESLETVAIDTESEYYDQKPWDCATQCPEETKGRPCGFCPARDIGARTRVEAKRRANLLKFSFPQKTKAVLIVT